MAAEFLASHGIDLSSVLASARSGVSSSIETTPHITKILNARLPHSDPSQTFDVEIAGISDRTIQSIEKHTPSHLPIANLPSIINVQGALLAPSLCHAHIHLDKCFLLSDQEYGDLNIQQGGFEEAMSLTNKAKVRFSTQSLLRRGRRLIKQSLNAGVTSMRAFVEVDELVELKCVHSAMQLRAEFAPQMEIQIVAFAQLALFSGDAAATRRDLLIQALEYDEVHVIGTTPYVEDDLSMMQANIRFAIELSATKNKHLDFHLDYNIDPNTEPMVWYVVQCLKESWQDVANSNHLTVCIGHATRLNLFTEDDWQKLFREVEDLPLSFIGLPTSDVFMTGRDISNPGLLLRGSLPVLDIENKHCNCAIAVNNVGNAFTPQGSCDPLSVASFGVAIYQRATTGDVEKLYTFVSSAARRAIGLEPFKQDNALNTLDLKQGSLANLMLLSWADEDMQDEPLTIAQAIYDPTSLKRKIIRSRGMKFY